MSNNRWGANWYTQSTCKWIHYRVLVRKQVQTRNWRVPSNCRGSRGGLICSKWDRVPFRDTFWILICRNDTSGSFLLGAAQPLVPLQPVQHLPISLGAPSHQGFWTRARRTRCPPSCRWHVCPLSLEWWPIEWLAGKEDTVEIGYVVKGFLQHDSLRVRTT